MYIRCLKAKEFHNGNIFTTPSTDLPEIQLAATDVPETVKYFVTFLWQYYVKFTFQLQTDVEGTVPDGGVGNVTDENL